MAVSTFRFLLIIFQLGLAGVALGQEMEFRSVSNGGNCGECGWVMAQGEITRNTPDRYRQFLAEQEKEFGSKLISYGVRLHSSGGDLGAALELGRLFRRDEVVTSVGKTVPLDATPWFLTEAGECLSACAYAFLGGTTRSLETGGFDNRLGFHQFFDLDILSNIAEPVFTGAERLRDQYVVGVIIEYLIEMGISTELYPLIAEIAPGEMLSLSRDQTETLRVVTLSRGAYWDLVPMGTGLVAESKMLQGRRRILRIYCRDPNNVHLTFYNQNRQNLNEQGRQRIDEYNARVMAGISEVGFERHAGNLFVKIADQSWPIRFNQYLFEPQQRFEIYDFSIPAEAVRNLATASGLRIGSNIEMVRAESGLFDNVSFEWRPGDPKTLNLIMRNCF